MRNYLGILLVLATMLPLSACAPFAPYRVVACPPGYHLGPHGRACWPND